MLTQYEIAKEIKRSGYYFVTIDDVRIKVTQMSVGSMLSTANLESSLKERELIDILKKWQSIKTTNL